MEVNEKGLTIGRLMYENGGGDWDGEGFCR